MKSNIITYEDIPRYLWIGRKERNWYQECEAAFIDIFGEEKLPLVTKLFAATSINTALKANITLFRQALYQIEQKLPIEGYMPNIQNQVTLVSEGKELSGRKINNFAKAMSGDKNAVVVDIWLTRAFNVDRYYISKSEKYLGRKRNGSATEGMYNQIENYIQTEAPKMGLEPREMCAMIWAGARIYTNGDTQTRYTEILRDKLTNLFGVI
jgi:hypothetical protein